MTDLGKISDNLCSTTARGVDSFKSSNLCGNKSNLATAVVEPSFQERYPEGRERLLALAESTKCQHQNGIAGLGGRSSAFSRDSCSPGCSSNNGPCYTPVKPKMGLKDIRNRTAARWHLTGSPATANGNNVMMYSSEQSLPEKLSQAIRGGISAALRGAGASASHNLNKASASGAVAADDVVYFSSSSTSASSQGGAQEPVPLRRPKLNDNPQIKGATGTLSRSTENLDSCGSGEQRAKMDVGRNRISQNRDAPQAKVDRPKNLAKVKNCASYGMNLEDLKKLYRSLPDCSTPVDDGTDADEMRDGLGDECRCGGDATAADSTKTEHVANNYGNCDIGTQLASFQLSNGVERETAPSCARTAFGLEAINDPRHEGYFSHRILSIDSCVHQRQRHQCAQRPCCEVHASPAMAALRHSRQPSSDSSNSAADDVRLKPPAGSPAQQVQQRFSAPYGVDFRDSCGSPTDSGYRSVPRSDEVPDQQTRLTGLPPTGHTALVTSRTQLYTAVPKQVTSVTGTHAQQAGDQTKAAESTTCNILIMPNAVCDGDYDCCASATAVIPTPPTGHTQGGRGDTGGRRQKSRTKQGGMHGIRMGSVPPPVHQSGGTSRHSMDDAAAVGTAISSCQSPYSEMNSPNYGTSTTSSSGASSAAVVVASQRSTPIVHPGLVSKVGGSTNALAPQHQRGAVNGASFDTINTNVSLPEEFSLERCPKLIELDRTPWNEKDIVAVLQKGRTRTLVNQIAIDVVPRLTYLLQRPLTRIAREAQRLCQRFNKCTKLDIHYAAKIILPTVIADSCHKAALQATAMFTMGGDTLKQSKSQRGGLRGLSVGKFHRWMCDAQLALCVLDQAAVYLTAVVENLLEEIVLQSVPQEGDMLTAEYLDVALANNVELWGLLQPYSHLICSRTANGLLGLARAATPCREGSTKSHSRQLSLQQPADCRGQHERSGGCGNNGTLVKNLEQCLLATCVGGTHELGELINRVLHHQVKGGSTPSLTSSSGVLSSATGKQSSLHWSKDALRTLFYFMRCSQLEHADNPHSSPPALVLAHERPYLVLPPLIEWLRVSQAHTEHRQGRAVDGNDVLQAARVLLPGLDCPSRPFGWEDASTFSDGASPQTWDQRLRADLAYRMLTSGSVDRATDAVGLLGTQKLSGPNEHGLTPLMWACYQGDEGAARILLDAGVDVNAAAFSHVTQQKANLVSPEMAGWTALTFAVAHRHYALAHLLLEKGAQVESSEMCTETPLQLAAMMGHHDLVNLLMSHGADPFYATISPDAGFKQRGCPSALSLAASHGHRTVLQAMLSRRRGRSEEVLSLEDFLAEGFGAPLGKVGHGNTNNNALKNHQMPVSPAASWLGKLTKSQQKILQEAMYHAAESGHLDITMDLRHLGTPWNTYIWTQTLATAYDLRRKALVQLLLGDFIKYHLDDLSQEFIDDCLPLLFEIFRQSKNEVSTVQLAEILSYLYGEEPIPQVGGSLAQAADLDENPMGPRIDAKYVNNPDLSDVQFHVEGRVFYGHKIVLINASERFKRLLQDGSTTVEVDCVRYEIFRMMMEFLYNGKSTVESNNDLSVISQLLCAANEFGVQPLRLHCGMLIARCVDLDSCIDIYRFAVRNEAVELARYCEAYFLQNLPTLISRVDGYRRLMMCNHSASVSMMASSSSDTNKFNMCNSSAGNAFDLADALLQTLTERLQQRMQVCRKL